MSAQTERNTVAGKDLATVAANYPVLDPAGQDAEIAEVMAENLGGDGVQFFDLDRITIPPGGGSAWEVPSVDGTDAVKELEGIVVAWRAPRAFWAERLEDSGGGTPPDCSSNDGVLGNGSFGVGSEQNPSGDCKSCPMNEWGSGRDGRGRACSESRQLFMLLPKRSLPVTVSLPVTSISPFRKYMLRLAGEGIPYYGVTTILGLRKIDGGGSIKYSVAEPRKGEVLDAETRAAAKHYGDGLRKSFEG